MELLKEVYTVKEVAELLGIKAPAVRARINKGNIKADTFNGAYIITKKEVARLLEEKGGK